MANASVPSAENVGENAAVDELEPNERNCNYGVSSSRPTYSETELRPHVRSEQNKNGRRRVLRVQGAGRQRRQGQATQSNRMVSQRESRPSTDVRNRNT